MIYLKWSILLIKLKSDLCEITCQPASLYTSLHIIFQPDLNCFIKPLILVDPILQIPFERISLSIFLLDNLPGGKKADKLILLLCWRKFRWGSDKKRRVFGQMKEASELAVVESECQLCRMWCNTKGRNNCTTHGGFQKIHKWNQ